MPIMLSLIGKDQSGKEDYAQALAKQHGYTVITLEAILNDLMAQPQELDDLTTRVRNALLAGQNLRDQDLVDLMASKVKSLRTSASGFVLLDFP